MSRAAAERAPEDGQPDAGARRRMLEEVARGLSGPRKELSPKYFYDARGAALFERITELPEYYLTRVERSLLERWMPSWIGELAPGALVELGSGSASKTRVLLDAMGPGSLFVPLDVSEEQLRVTAVRLRAEYPHLRVVPRVVDITRPLVGREPLPRPTLFALLGSTIGNFARAQAIQLLRNVREAMSPGDRFLMGADLRPGHGKSREALEAAYNDAEGVTEAFNLNVLRVLNRDLGADFDPGSFAHRAFYDDEEARIEMHLVARAPQVVTLPGGVTVRFDEGESVRTEISCKYDRREVDRIFAGAGLEVACWREDDAGRYVLVLGRPAGL